MGAKKVLIDLYYDVVSPYSWISFEQLCRYRNHWPSMQFKLKPFYIRAIFGGSNNRPGFHIPNKIKYGFKDIERLNKFYKIPIVFPVNYMEIVLEKTSLRAQRFVTAIDLVSDGKYTEDISRQLFKRVFTSHQDITQIESFREAANEANIENNIIEKAIENFERIEIKDRLKEITSEALSLGAFGAPHIVVHLPTGPQLIFGSDRMEIIASLIGEKYFGPLNQFSKI